MCILYVRVPRSKGRGTSGNNAPRACVDAAERNTTLEASDAYYAADHFGRSVLRCRYLALAFEMAHDGVGAHGLPRPSCQGHQDM